MVEDWLYYVTNPQQLSENFPRLSTAQRLQLMRDFLAFSEASITENRQIMGCDNIDALSTISTVSSNNSTVLNNLSNSLTNGNHFIVDGDKSAAIRYQRHFVLDALALRLWAHMKLDLAFLRAACQPLVLHAHILQALMRSVGGEEAVQLMYGEPRWLLPPSILTNGLEADSTQPVISPEVKFVYILYHRWAVQLSSYTNLLHRCNRPNACPIKKGFTQLPDMQFEANSQRECHNVLKRVPLSVDFLTRILKEESPLVNVDKPINSSPSNVLYRGLHPQGFQVLEMGSKACIYNSSAVNNTIIDAECPPELVHLIARLDLGRYFMQQKQFNFALEHFHEMELLAERLISRGVSPDLLPLSLDYMRKYLFVCENIRQQILTSCIIKQAPTPSPVSPTSDSSDGGKTDSSESISARRRAYRLIDTIIQEKENANYSSKELMTLDLVEVLMCDLCVTLNPHSNDSSKTNSPISLEDRKIMETKVEQWVDRLQVRTQVLCAKTCFIKLLICNLLYRIVDGRAILSPLLHTLTDFNSFSINCGDVNPLLSASVMQQEYAPTPHTIHIIHFLLCQVARCFRAIQDLKNGNHVAKLNSDLSGGSAERMNLVCFLWFLCQSFPWEWNVSQSILHSDVALLLKKEEVSEFQVWATRNEQQLGASKMGGQSNIDEGRAMVEDDLCLLDLEDDLSTWDTVAGVDITGTEGQDDWFPGDDLLYHETWNKETGTVVYSTTDSTTTESEANMFPTAASSIADGMRLLSSYDPEEIAALVQRLIDHEQWTSVHQLRDMSVNWHVVPPAIAQPLANSPLTSGGTKVSRATAHILVAKALCLRQLQDWQTAKQLLQAAEKQVQELYQVKKLISFEILLIDLEHCLLGSRKDIFDSTSAACSELRRRSMSCLTCVRTEAMCSIREDVVLTVTCHLLAIKDYDYLIKGSNGGSAALELGRRMASLSKDLMDGKVITHSRESSHLITPSSMFWEYLHRCFTPGSANTLPNLPSAAGYRRPGMASGETLHLSISQLLTFVRLLHLSEHFDMLITGTAALLNTCRSDVNLHPAVGPFCNAWPTSFKVPDSSAAQLTEFFRIVLDTGLSTVGYTHQQCPHIPNRTDLDCLINWWLLRAELCYTEMQYSHALRAYLQAIMVGTDYFTLPVSEAVFSSRVIDRLIRCLEILGYIAQAVVLSQWIEQGTKVATQLLRNTNIPFDCIDSYVDYLWDINLIEILAAYEFKNGVPYRAKEIAATIGRAELNINNHDLVLQEAIKRRKIEFLKVLIDSHLCV